MSSDPDRRIWLHIGQEKTGTKSIQKFAAAHRDQLLESGLVYPQLGFHQTAHYSLVGSVLNDLPDHEPLEFGSPGTMEEEWGALGALLAERPDDDVLLSAEHFSSRLRPSGIEAVARWFDAAGYLDNVRVVVNVRRQDEFVLSTYGMSVRHGGSKSIDEYLESHLIEDHRRYDHATLLADWAASFGDDRLVVGVHEAHAMPNGVLPAFFDRIGRPELGSVAPGFHENASWPLEALEVARLLNQADRAFPEPERFAIARKVASLGFATPVGRLLGFEERQAIIEQFSASNEAAAKRVHGTTGVPLFRDPVPTQPRLSTAEVRSLGQLAITMTLLDLTRGEQHVHSLRGGGPARQLAALRAQIDELTERARHLEEQHALRGEVLRRLIADEQVPKSAIEAAIGGPRSDASRPPDHPG